jgi:hypothetical protein
MSRSPSSADATTASVTRRPEVLRAGRLLVVAVALGVVGQLLFFDVGIGINLPIAIALLVGCGWIVRRQAVVPLIDGWLGPAAIGFAIFAALRSDASLVALDTMTSLALAGGALASYGGRPVVSRSFGALLALAVSALGWATTGAVAALYGARLAMPSRRTTASRM